MKELDKAAQFHDMTYAIFKDKKDRNVFDKKLQDEAFNIVKDSKHSLKDRAEAGLAVPLTSWPNSNSTKNMICNEH